MKNIILLSIAIALSSLAFASDDVKEMDVNGLKVIYKASPKDVISVRLFVEGGTANYSSTQEGIEALAFMLAMQGGTESMDKLTFNAAAESMGASYFGESTYDNGTMSMTCIKPYWDKSWDLFADAIMNPLFDAKEFKIVQEQMLANAKQNDSDPDARLRALAMENAFGNSDYTKQPDGSVESIPNISLQAVKSYYLRTLGKARCFLVVVGNVSEADIRAKVEATLAQLPMGTPFKAEKRKIITEGSVHIENRDIATNYLRGVMSAPLMSEEEGVAMRIAMNILRGVFFEELRTKRSLSYAPSAFYSTGVIRNPYSVVYISTTDPQQSIEVMVSIMDDIKKNGFKEKQLTDRKATFLTQYYMGLESSAAQSNALGVAELAGGWELEGALRERVSKLTLGQLNKVFDKYTFPIVWTYLGKEEMVKKEDFKQTAKPDVNRHY